MFHFTYHFSLLVGESGTFFCYHDKLSWSEPILFTLVSGRCPQPTGSYTGRRPASWGEGEGRAQTTQTHILTLVLLLLSLYLHKVEPSCPQGRERRGGIYHSPKPLTPYILSPCTTVHNHYTWWRPWSDYGVPVLQGRGEARALLYRPRP